MADCELVLRFFAIRETILEDKRGSLKRLMDKSMEKHSGDTVNTVVALEADYRDALGFLFHVFEGKPFVLPETNRPSRPAYDALMVAYSLVGQDNLAVHEASMIRANFLESASDSLKYEVLVGRGNTVEAIKERVNLAKVILT